MDVVACPPVIAGVISVAISVLFLLNPEDLVGMVVIVVSYVFKTDSPWKLKPLGSYPIIYTLGHLKYTQKK